MPLGVYAAMWLPLSEMSHEDKLFYYGSTLLRKGQLCSLSDYPFLYFPWKWSVFFYLLANYLISRRRIWWNNHPSLFHSSKGWSMLVVLLSREVIVNYFGLYRWTRHKHFLHGFYLDISLGKHNMEARSPKTWKQDKMLFSNGTSYIPVQQLESTNLCYASL